MAYLHVHRKCTVDEFQDKKDGVAKICARWRVRELCLFGSAARGELTPESDVDLLVSFAPDADWDMLDLLHLGDELEALFGRKVDLVEREAVAESDNWIVRGEIFRSAEPFYAST
jgi:uncharacterized protein